MPLAAPPAMLVAVVAEDTVPVTLTVTAPVPPDIEMLVPATMLVTPVLDSVTVPPRDTGDPATPKPVPPITVMELLVSAPFGIPVKFVPVRVGVVIHTGFALVDPWRTPVAPARADGTPVEP